MSHGVTIRCLLSKISGISLRDTENLPICRNTAISKLRFEAGRFTAEYMNDYSHIIPLGSLAWSKSADLLPRELQSRFGPGILRALLCRRLAGGPRESGWVFPRGIF